MKSGPVDLFIAINLFAINFAQTLYVLYYHL